MDLMQHGVALCHSVLNAAVLSVAVKQFAPQSQLTLFFCLEEGEKKKHRTRLLHKLLISLLNHPQIFFLTPSDFEALNQDFQARGEPSFKKFRKQYGLEKKVDFLFTVRNWHFHNTFLAHVFHESLHLCYGDSLGLYFPPTYKLAQRHWLQRKWLGIKSKIKFHPTQSRSLPMRPYDQALLALPEVFGPPQMNWTCLDRMKLHEALGRLDVGLKLRRKIEARYPGSAFFWVLGSALSESGLMPAEQEVEGYVSMIKARNVPTSRVLIYKPHPRDKANKVGQLQRQLATLGYRVHLADRGLLTILPIESLLQGAFKPFGTQPSVELLTTGCTALTLHYLYEWHQYEAFSGHFPLSMWRRPIKKWLEKFETDILAHLNSPTPNGL